MVTYGYRLDNITVSYNTITSYDMTTPNYSEEVSGSVSAAVGILTSATPNLVIPVDTASISTSTSSTLAAIESSISQPAYSVPDPNVLVVTTFSTTTVPYTDPVVQVPTQPSTDNVEPTLVSTFLLYGFPVAVTPSSTIDIAPSVTILPTIPPIAPPLLNSTSPTSFSTLTLSYIDPTSLETLTSTPPPTPLSPISSSSSSSSSSANNPASTTSTIPRPTTSSNSSSSNSVGVYVGAATGGALSLILSIFVIFCLLRRRKRRHPKHHPDRPAFIGGYELKLDKVGDLQRVVHEKRVRRHTFEAWKRGVVPGIDSGHVAEKSEVHVPGETPLTGYSNSLDELAEDAPVFEANEEREVFRKGVETSIEDEHDGYVVSPIEEQGEERWPEVEGQKAGRPISGNIPLIFQWEKRAEQKRDSTTGTIGQTM